MTLLGYLFFSCSHFIRILQLCWLCFLLLDGADPEMMMVPSSLCTVVKILFVNRLSRREKLCGSRLAVPHPVSPLTLILLYFTRYLPGGSGGLFRRLVGQTGSNGLGAR